MKAFDYYQPRTLREALELLNQRKGKWVLMAGGTDLLIELKKGERIPDGVIGIHRIPELNFIKSDGDLVKFGACVPLSAVANSPIVQREFKAIAETMQKMGSVQIRNRATLGGNICYGNPAADSPPILLVLGARTKIVNENGARVVPLEELFLGPRQTAIGADEIMTEIWVPKMLPRTVAAYVKFGPRKAMDIARVGIALAVRFDSEHLRFEDAKVAFGAVAAIPMRARETEKELVGQAVTPEFIERAAHKASRECQPRSSAAYRSEMVGVLLRRALTEISGRAGAGPSAGGASK